MRFEKGAKVQLHIEWIDRAARLDENFWSLHLDKQRLVAILDGEIQIANAKNYILRIKPALDLNSLQNNLINRQSVNLFEVQFETLGSAFAGE